MAIFTLELDDDTLRKLTEAARKAGVTPERMAEMLVETWLLADEGRPPPGVGEPARAWAGATEKGGDPREDSAANYDLNEAGRPWSKVRPEFMALIDKTFGKPE